MKKINELRDYLLENYVNGVGDLDICGLDFSDFDGDIHIGGMRVKGDYYATNINVTGEITFEEPKKVLQEITIKELGKMGYKTKEEEK